jgi:HD-GYP domain-containing protein (c-di-GMP phosphodiesterase class II)
MTALPAHLGEATAPSSLSQRLRAIGLLVIGCDCAGSLCERPPRGTDWLTDLCCDSPLFRGALRAAAARWAGEATPTVTEAFPGLHLVAMPIVNRRRRRGYLVAVVPAADLLESEQLVAMCESARQDFTLTARRIAALPPVATAEVERVASMVRFAHEDQSLHSADSQSIESFSQQLAESYEEISLLYTIIQGMRVADRPERFVTMACHELLVTLPYAWVGVQMSPRPERLARLAGRLILAGRPPEEPVDALQAPIRDLLDRVQPDETTVLEPAFRPDDARFRPLGRTVLAHPITSENEVLGLLLAGDKEGADAAASSTDMKLLAATASHLAIFLENAALYQDLNAMFLGTLEALVASIDAKDRYTCGHSQRVAELTRQLATAVGLDEKTVERLHIAGLVHDVGKIGVPEHILLKPGRLTPEEFEWIKRHPVIGHRILKDIPRFEDILPAVLHHHERWDGDGYPQGLRGEAIPLSARLVSLPDCFDAMSSSRTYRPSMSRAEVLEEIRRCASTQFDPGLVDTFLALDFRRWDELVAEQREAELGAGGHEAAA